MKKCKHCNAEVAKSAKVCPKCGGKLGMPKILSFLITIFIIIGIIAIIANGGDKDVKKKIEEEKFSYEITKTYHGDHNIGYYIEGIVTNKKDKEYAYVQIEFVCYDKDGNNLGTAIDNSNNLLGNQTWKFKAFYLGADSKDVDHCDYHEITSW